MAHTECLVHNYVISHSTCLYICNMDYFSIKMSFCSAVWCLRDPPSYRWQRDSWRGGGWSHWYCLVSSGGPRPPPGSPSPRTLASPGWWSQRWRAPVSLPPSPRESPPLSTEKGTDPLSQNIELFNCVYTKFIIIFFPGLFIFIDYTYCNFHYRYIKNLNILNIAKTKVKANMNRSPEVAHYTYLPTLSKLCVQLC